jgi:hypothetical protein
VAGGRLVGDDGRVQDDVLVGEVEGALGAAGQRLVGADHLGLVAAEEGHGASKESVAVRRF